MDIKLLYQPSYTMANVRLSSGEEIQAESGAMVSKTEGVEIETKMKGGLFKALGRSLLNKESFFMNTFRAGGSGGEVNLAPALPGDMFVVELAKPMLIQSGSYVASEKSVEIDTKFGGRKDIFCFRGPFSASSNRFRKNPAFKFWRNT